MSFSKKRRFGNDDFQQPFRKRFRLPPHIELARTLCSDINTLGESSKNFHEDVEFMSKPIVLNFEVEKEFRDAILKTLFAVITEQPQKLLHISVLVQVVNSQLSSFVKVLSEYFIEKVEELVSKSLSKDNVVEASDIGPWDKTKLILRFLSTLTFAVEESSIFEMLKKFLQLAIDLQSSTPDKRNPLGEALYYNTLVSLPYTTAFNHFDEAIQREVDEILQYAEKFKVVPQDISITKPFLNDGLAPYKPKELVSLILPSVKEFLGNDLKNVTAIFPNFAGVIKELISKVEKISLPEVTLPKIEDLKRTSGLDTGLGSVDGMWRTPRFTFSTYLPIDGLETVPPNDSYISLLFRDIAIDITEALEFNRKEVARQIITLDLFFNEGLFAPPGVTIDGLKEISKVNQTSQIKSSTWKTEDAAVESVLSLIFKLPTVSQPFVYFYTTLVAACNNASQAIAPVMGRAIRFFYANLDNLDFELKLRYLDWLSVQLSNFNFTWKWKEWESDSSKNSKSSYHPRIAFIRNLIAKELRLTTKEKIQQTITEEFYQYLDISLFESSELRNFYIDLFGEERLSSVDFNFDEENKLFFLKDGITFKPQVEKLIEIVHKNSDIDEFKSVLQNIRDEAKVYPNPDKLVITLVFQVIIFVGNRSISHAGKYILNTIEVLKSLVGIEETNEGEVSKDDEDQKMKDIASSELTQTQILKRQEWVIDSILKYWNLEPENGYLVLDILENFGVLSSISLIKYSLDDSHSKNLGLISVSATESIFRVLRNAVFVHNANKELIFTFNELIKLLQNSLKEINVDGEITFPDVNEEFSETNEKIWKYHAILSVVKALLREFSDEYNEVLEVLSTMVEDSIKHTSTKRSIESWFNELPKL